MGKPCQRDCQPVIDRSMMRFLTLNRPWPYHHLWPTHWTAAHQRRGTNAVAQFVGHADRGTLAAGSACNHPIVTAGDTRLAMA